MNIRNFHTYSSHYCPEYIWIRDGGHLPMWVNLTAKALLEKALCRRRVTKCRRYLYMLFNKQVHYIEQNAAQSRNVHETQLKMDIILAIGHAPDLSEDMAKLEALKSQLKRIRKEGK